MKNSKVLVILMALFLTMSSFGVVENNKYVKAKIEQETFKNLENDRNHVVQELLVQQAEPIEIEENSDFSLAQKVGDFLVDNVKKSFTAVLKFFVSFIK